MGSAFIPTQSKLGYSMAFAALSSQLQSEVSSPSSLSSSMQTVFCTAGDAVFSDEFRVTNRYSVKSCHPAPVCMRNRHLGAALICTPCPGHE